MQTKLSLQEKLKDERTNRHMTLAQLEKATGIPRSSLGKYESDNCTDISPYNLAILAKYYGVSMDYLMGLTENKNHPNTALYELHLDDNTVDFLKSGKINNRLLCEMICHPAFRRLMADIEVCVDRIADSRIKDMNLCLDEARKKIVQKYHPDEDDTMLRTLDMARIDDEILFANTFHRDLDIIVKDIREAHVSDPTTAEQETFVEVAAKDMEALLQEAMDYVGNANAKRAFLICRTLKIKYERLSDEDKKVLGRVFARSEILDNIFSQRGKSMPPQKTKKRR